MVGGCDRDYLIPKMWQRFHDQILILEQVHPSLLVRDPEDIFDRVRLPSLEVLQPLLNTIEPAGNHLLRLRLEPALLQALGEIPHVQEPEVRLLLVHRPDHGAVHRDAAAHLLLLDRQHGGDGGAIRERLAEVDIAALLGHGVVRVQQLGPLGGLLDALDDRVVAVAVVDHGVALGRVDELPDVVLRLARDADERVDVGPRRELHRVDAHGRRGAVDDQRRRPARGLPRRREAELGVEPRGGRQRGQGDGGGLLEGGRLGDVRRRVGPRHGVLGVAAARRHHLVEGHDAVARLELGHVGADLVHHAGDVVALVEDLAWHPLGHLPVLGVGAADRDLDDDLVIVGLRHWRLDGLDRRS